MTTRSAAVPRHPRALILAEADRLHCRDHDRALARALGLVLSGCLIIGWALLRLLDAIGAS